MAKIVVAILSLGICVLARAEGKNLVRESGAERTADIADYPDSERLTSRCPDRNYAPGWGVYNGGGGISWGVTAAESRSGDRAAFMRIVRPIKYDGKFFYSGALLLGEGDGYNGENALEVKPDTRYKFSVWVKTTTPCEVNVSANAYMLRKGRYFRLAQPIASLMVDGKAIAAENALFSVMADDQWRRLEGTFVTGIDTEYANALLGLKRSVDRIEEFKGVTLFADDAMVMEQ